MPIYRKTSRMVSQTLHAGVTETTFEDWDMPFMAAVLTVVKRIRWQASLTLLMT